MCHHLFIPATPMCHYKAAKLCVQSMLHFAKVLNSPMPIATFGHGYQALKKTVPRSGAMCLRHGETGSLGDAFEKIDGGSDRDRACRGMNTSDWSPSYFEFFAASKSIEDCKSRCLENPMCQGIELNGYGCKVWTVIVTTSIGFSGTTCLRYSAFAGVDGGARHGCYGVDPVETTALQFPADSVAEQCRSACAQSVGCQGVEYNETSCEVWSSRILGSYANVKQIMHALQTFHSCSWRNGQGV